MELAGNLQKISSMRSIGIVSEFPIENGDSSVLRLEMVRASSAAACCLRVFMGGYSDLNPSFSLSTSISPFQWILDLLSDPVVGSFFFLWNQSKLFLLHFFIDRVKLFINTRINSNS